MTTTPGFVRRYITTLTYDHDGNQIAGDFAPVSIEVAQKASTAITVAVAPDGLSLEAMERLGKGDEPAARRLVVQQPNLPEQLRQHIGVTDDDFWVLDALSESVVDLLSMDYRALMDFNEKLMAHRERLANRLRGMPWPLASTALKEQHRFFARLVMTDLATTPKSVLVDVYKSDPNFYVKQLAADALYQRGHRLL